MNANRCNLKQLKLEEGEMLRNETRNYGEK